MKAMILAAGLGKRMRPLTDSLPKPLIEVRGKPLIAWHLERIARVGITEVVINLAYLGHMIRDYVGDGSRWGLSVHYSVEPEPLETGGAIVHASGLLGDEPFVLINADVFTQFEILELTRPQLRPEEMGRLVLVPNPEFKEIGDFSLADGGALLPCGEERNFTFAGISLLRPSMITSYPQRRRVFGLAEVFRWCISRRQLTGLFYGGLWNDVGTIARLEALNVHQAE